ncbi:MAG TPA: ABC transporter permease [Bacteroidales bacterium]|nr:ABC transporter permease [Bacteroidales bacterium]
MKRSAYNLRIAVEAVMINRFRSFLTALGIIFGVAAVIAMMAIGNGARQEILDQMRLVGVNNIIIQPLSPEDGQEEDTDVPSGPEKFSPGLSLQDARSIALTLPGIAGLSPQVIYETDLVHGGRRAQARVSGVSPDYFNIFNLTFLEGRPFSPAQMGSAAPVCVIGSGLRARFFPDREPLGAYLKAGGVWFRVIGVLEESPVPGGLADMGIEDHNEMLYAPASTVLLRLKDRTAITASSLHAEEEGGAAPSTGLTSVADVEGHQLDRVIVQMAEATQLRPASEVMERMLLRRHGGVVDYSVRVPELLLKQEQRTREIFNIVLGAIAGIALLVGGIGIMNIMLANVMERIREIGVRQAMGARPRDIAQQFLAEATLISIGGGILGVLLGIGLSLAITRVAGIPTIISLWSILISFLVSAAVGMLFGYMPARRAASQDPVVSLRYE